MLTHDQETALQVAAYGQGFTHGLKGCDIVATCYGISNRVTLKVLNSRAHSGPLI